MQNFPPMLWKRNDLPPFHWWQHYSVFGRVRISSVTLLFLHAPQGSVLYSTVFNCFNGIPLFNKLEAVANDCCI